MMRRALLPLALLAAAVAAAAPADTARASDMVALRERVAVGPLRVRPLAVVEDSRCPSGVMCIWAGRVVLRVSVEGPGISRTLTLTGDTPFPLPGGTLALVRVAPAKARAAASTPAAYRFGFAFTPAQP